MAASLPMVVALVAMIGTFLALFLVALVTDVSIFSINLTTALGLGLAIDYCLFIVNRFREELRRGPVDRRRGRPHGGDRGPDRGVLGPHGRGVAGGAARVPALLPALVRLRRASPSSSLAAAGLAAHAAGAARRPRAADRRGRIARRRRAPRADESGFWHRLATAVMRRPMPVATAVVALLLVLGTPFLGVDCGLPSYLALPASSRGPPDVRPR